MHACITRFFCWALIVVMTMFAGRATAQAGLVLSPSAGVLDAQYGVSYSQTFAVANGIGPFAYTISQPLPAGMDFISGTLSGVPTSPGDHVLSVMVTDLGAAGSASTITNTYTLRVAAATIDIGPNSIPDIPAGAYPIRIGLSASGGIAPYTYRLESISRPSSVNVIGDSLEFPPQLYTGTLQFTVRAVDATGQAGTRIYSVNIVRPVIDLSGNLPAGAAGQPYVGSVSLVGSLNYYGDTSYSIVSGLLPPGLMLGGCTTPHCSIQGAPVINVVGTPTVSGTYAFTIAARDGTQGDYGQVTRQFSITIADSPFILNPLGGALPEGEVGLPYRLTFSPSNTAYGPYTYEVFQSALPAGLTLDPDTGVLSGVPRYESSMRYPFTFSIRVTGASGVTATDSYSMIVRKAAFAIDSTPLPPATAGMPYSATRTAVGGNPPYVFSPVGPLPSGMLLNTGNNGFTFHGTPTTPGEYQVSILGVTSTNETVEARFTFTVLAPDISFEQASLPDTIIAQPYNQILTSVGGTAPYRFALASGSLPPGIVLNETGRFSGAATQTGTFEFSVSVRDALGFTGMRAYRITVVQRPDPTQNADVRRQLAAQADASRRFAGTQILNFSNRMEFLHRRVGREDGVGFTNSLNFSVRPSCVQDTGAIPGDICSRKNTGGEESAAENAAVSPPRNGVESGGGRSHGFWVGGTLRSGDAGDRGGADFETDGVTAGVDFAINNDFVLGAGLGYGRDDTRIEGADGRVDGKATTAAVYASYHPGEVFYLDVVLGHQWLTFDLRRTGTINIGRLLGEREGGQWFGSISAGAELMRGKWVAVPYGRLDISRTRLDSYVETGDPLQALRYGPMTVDSTTGVAGFRVNHHHKIASWSFSPQLRLEYQYDFEGDAEATLRYADNLGLVYRTNVSGYDRNRLVLGIGAQFESLANWTVQVEYRSQVDGETRDNAANLIFGRRY